MKKILSLILSLVMILSFAGCATEAQATWQEHYDLGLKYVGEVKYEEAILSFTKALEIDPKQADIYIRLADAYIASGDIDSAIAILDKGFENTQSELIVSKKEELTVVKLSADDPFRQKSGFVEFEQLSPELQTAIERLIQTTVSGNTPNTDDINACNTLLNSGIFYNTYLNTVGVKIYTFTEGNKVYITIENNTYTVEIRPENGTGYYTDVYYRDSIKGYSLAVCECIGWQFNGVMKDDGYSIDESGNWYLNDSTTGTLVNNRRHGEFEKTWRWFSTDGTFGYSTHTNTFDHGIMVRGDDYYLYDDPDSFWWGGISPGVGGYHWTGITADALREHRAYENAW